MLDVLQLSADRWYLRRMFEDVVIKVAIVVDLVDELIHARCRFGSAAL